MIYFAQIDKIEGPIKIGFALNPEKRIERLQKQMPWKLKILRVIEGTKKEESKIHRKLNLYRITDQSGREWFNIDCLKYLNFLEIIKERNLSADRDMSGGEWQEYFKILLNCVK